MIFPSTPAPAGGAGTLSSLTGIVLSSSPPPKVDTRSGWDNCKPKTVYDPGFASTSLAADSQNPTMSEYIGEKRQVTRLITVAIANSSFRLVPLVSSRRRLGRQRRDRYGSRRAPRHLLHLVQAQGPSRVRLLRHVPPFVPSRLQEKGHWAQAAEQDRREEEVRGSALVPS